MAISEFEMLEHLEHDLRGTAQVGYARNLLHSRSKTAVKGFFLARTNGLDPEKLRKVNLKLNKSLGQKGIAAGLPEKMSRYARGIRGHLERITASSEAIGEQMRTVASLSARLRNAHMSQNQNSIQDADARIQAAHPEIVKTLKEHADYLHTSAQFIRERVKELRYINRQLVTPSEIQDNETRQRLIETAKTNKGLGVPPDVQKKVKHEISRLELKKNKLANALEQLELAHQNARSMADILRDVLSPHPSTFSTERIREQLMELGRDARYVGMRVSLPDAIPEGLIKGRRILIRRAFKNLVLNAHQHDAKLTEIQARHSQDADGNAGIRFTVTNNGLPIPAHVLPHMGEKFATFRESGTGLGLHFVRKVVEYHGGTWYTPQSNGTKGASFSFFIPFAESQTPVKQAEAQTKRSGKNKVRQRLKQRPNRFTV